MLDVTEDALRVSQTGVTWPSLLNDLEYFHVTHNYAPGIMHDLLEGGCPYELKLVLQVLIRDKKHVSLNMLNERISSFNYGYSDSGSRPTELI